MSFTELVVMFTMMSVISIGGFVFCLYKVDQNPYSVIFQASGVVWTVTLFITFIMTCYVLNHPDDAFWSWW